VSEHAKDESSCLACCSVAWVQIQTTGETRFCHHLEIMSTAMRGDCTPDFLLDFCHNPAYHANRMLPQI
jgi:hypothetical protein